VHTAEANVRTRECAVTALTVVHIPIKNEHTLRASCLRVPTGRWVTQWQFGMISKALWTAGANHTQK